MTKQRNLKMGKKIDQILTKEDIQVVKKHMKMMTGIMSL